MYVKSAPSFISFISIAVLALSGTMVYGQASSARAANNQAQPSRSASEHETDIGVSGYEAMNSSTTANGVIQQPTNSAGAMLEIRHIQSPLVGYELTYSYNKGDQTISPVDTTNCVTYSQYCPVKLTATASLVGLNWVLSKKFGNLRPFFAGGIGFFIDEPGASTYGVNDTTRVAWLYGGGVDYSFSTHLGLRAQYRGVMYKVPNLSMLYPAQGVYTTTSEPMGGIFYRF